MRRTLSILAAVVIAGAGLLAGTGGTAAADTVTPTQSRIDAILEKHADATQTGKEIITFSDGVQLRLGAAATGPCPQESLCFWEHDHFGGELLSYPGPLCRSGTLFNFDDRGFNDRASSWQNNSPSFAWYAEVFADYGGGGTRLWEMLPSLDGPGLPKRYNDAASSMYCEPF